MPWAQVEGPQPAYSRSTTGTSLAYLITSCEGNEADDFLKGLPAIKNDSIAYKQQVEPVPSEAQRLLPPLPSRPVTRRLPSLLSYIDYQLMKESARHNQPPHPAAICSFCFAQWDSPNQGLKPPNPFANLTVIPSTFLPLSPCGHWMHYRCLIWLATRNNDLKANCFVCKTPLFQWEGITALTLATRTGLEMEDGSQSVIQIVGSNLVQQSDKADYETECVVIESLIHAQFFARLAEPSGFGDNSPDLVRCLFDVLNALARLKRPQAKWLKFSTQTGYALYTMLVVLKMRRYLLNSHAKIVVTDGWRKFEEEKLMLQRSLLAEVHNESG